MQWQYEHPDYGWMLYKDLPTLLDEIGKDIEGQSIAPGEITLKVRVVNLSQEEIDALPTTDELDNA